MSNRSFHLLAPAGEALIAAYEGADEYIFKVPALAGEGGSPSMREFKLSYHVSKGTAFDASDYLRLETSPDEGTTWCKLPVSYDDSDGANFLDGKSGTSGKFEAVVRLFPGQWVRLTANAGLTLNKVGFTY